MACDNCQIKNIIVKPVVFTSEVMIVGESPGREEEIQGKPFVGQSGKLLDYGIQNILKMDRKRICITNATLCRIPNEVKQVKSILRKVIANCRENLVNTIQTVKPKYIITLGEVATMQVLNKQVAIGGTRGRFIQSKEFNCWVLPTYHPSVILRNGGIQDSNLYWVMWKKDLETFGQFIRGEIEQVQQEYSPYRGNSEFSSSKFIAIDAEWNEEGKLIVFSLSDGNKTRYVWIDDITPYTRKALGNLFRKPLVFANRPVDEKILESQVLTLPKTVKIDIFNIAKLIDDNLNISLESISERFTNEGKIKDVSKEVNKKVWLLEKDKLIAYNCKDAEVTAKAFKTLFMELKKDTKLLNYWKNFTLKIEDMLANISKEGFKIDRTKLDINKNIVAEEIAKKEIELISQVHPKILEAHKDKGLSLTRGDFLIDILYGKYGLRLKPNKLTPTGRPSLREDDLIEFANKKWVADYLHWKKLHKLYSTFLLGLERNMDDKGFIYPNTVLYATVTGRTACFNPNLQQIPRNMPMVEKVKELFEAPEGWLIGTRDLSQSEIRVMGWLAQDKGILDALRQKKDIHTRTASLVLNKKEEDVTKEERQMAKCFHPEVEVLTKKGWIAFKDYNGEDEILQAIPEDNKGITLKWVKPLHFELRKNHHSHLIWLKNKGIDIKITPDHRCLIQNIKGEFKVTYPNRMARARKWWNAGMIEKDDYISEEERILKLVVATQADGSFKGRLITFGFTKKRKVQRLISLLNNGEYVVRTIGRKYKYTAITLKDEDLIRKIKRWLTEDKKLTWDLLELDPKLIKVFIDELRYWDGIYFGRRIIYSSKHKENCDIVQAMCSIVNLKSRITYDKKNVYVISISDHPFSRGGNVQKELIDYTDEVAVISVPSSFILVRSNGIPLITGQCLNFGFLYGASAKTFMEYAKVNYGVEVSYEEAEKLRNKFFEVYNAIPIYHRRCIEITKKYGYIRNALGRIRRLPHIYSDDFSKVAEAERQAINFPIQSFSSELALIGMYLFWKEVKHKQSVKVLWFIHDSVFFMCRENLIDEYMALLKECLEERSVEYIKKYFGIKVGYPVESDGKVGKNWATLQEVK